MLLNILNISSADIDNYSVHAAKSVGDEHPLTVFLNDETDFQNWNNTRGMTANGKPKNRYGGRKYIIQFADFHPEYKTLLFTGIFEITAVHDDRYETRLVENGSEVWIGKLKITMETGRNTIFTLGTALNKMKFKEIRQTRYECEPFKGYENVCLSFNDLGLIFIKEREDWKTALEKTKGIYLITDKYTGRLYVGKADGKNGLWSRWRQYINNGHGDNVRLTELVKTEGQEYTHKHFQMTLLEAHTRVTDDFINDRESFWKVALGSRDFGYNAN